MSRVSDPPAPSLKAAPNHTKDPIAVSCWDKRKRKGPGHETNNRGPFVEDSRGEKCLATLEVVPTPKTQNLPFLRRRPNPRTLRGFPWEERQLALLGVAPSKQNRRVAGGNHQGSTPKTPPKGEANQKPRGGDLATFAPDSNQKKCPPPPGLPGPKNSSEREEVRMPCASGGTHGQPLACPASKAKPLPQGVSKPSAKPTRRPRARCQT